MRLQSLPTLSLLLASLAFCHAPLAPLSGLSCERTDRPAFVRDSRKQFCVDLRFILAEPRHFACIAQLRPSDNDRAG